VKKFLSILLICILSLPTIFGLNHFLSEEHIVCNDQQVHIHQSELDCSTCDFIRISFDYNSNDFEYSENYFFFLQENIILQTETPSLFFINYFYLRGPPSNYSFS